MALLCRRTVQLLHNHRTRVTGESLLQSLGWQMMDGVLIQLGKIDRDKAKHHQIKTSPAYNGRQKALRIEKRTRIAADPELTARAEASKAKTKEKKRVYYSAQRQLLYERRTREEGEKVVKKRKAADSAEGTVTVVKKQRGRPRKMVPTAVEEDKENVDPSLVTKLQYTLTAL